MQAAIDTVPRSKAQRWTSRLMSGLPALFLLVDGAMKLFKPAVVVETTKQLGYGESVIVPLGVVLLVSTVLYLVPRTAVLGAILLTGYLGGAVNTHVRVNEGWFPILFPILIGVLLWGGLYLRDAHLPTLMPLTTKAAAASKKMFWGGWVMSVLPLPLLLFSIYAKLSSAPEAMEGFTKYGYQPQAPFAIGIVELLCAALYLIPSTAVLGAILLTGYLGGATATHVRVGEPYFMPVLFGVLFWGGLYLRDARLRALLPWRS
jgi:hypothetical protein